MVLCEPTRTQIVRALGTGRITVTDLAAAVGRSRPVASQHLRLLREEGFVRAKRRGRRVYYMLTSDPAARSASQMLDLVAQTTSYVVARGQALQVDRQSRAPAASSHREP